tara:strand:- start:3112 stop:3237 length:126 start_codon:yes stop_codon:yes gene_type:complete
MVEQLTVNQLVAGSNPALGGDRTLSKATGSCQGLENLKYSL